MPCKRKTGRTRKGNRYVRRLLCECAHAASRTTSVFKLKYTSLAIRHGHKRPIIALAHKLLRTCYFMISRGDCNNLNVGQTACFRLMGSYTLNSMPFMLRCWVKPPPRPLFTCKKILDVGHNLINVYLVLRTNLTYNNISLDSPALISPNLHSS